MSEIKVTVQDFVDRFKELNLTPVTTEWGLTVSKGVIEPKNGCSCALGVMIIGTDLGAIDHYEDELDENGAVTFACAWAADQGINTEDFLSGYDWFEGDIYGSTESFELGKNVRKALGL